MDSAPSVPNRLCRHGTYDLAGRAEASLPAEVMAHRQGRAAVRGKNILLDSLRT
jgi:hypothetical protein